MKTVGALIDEMSRLREERRILAEKDKALKEAYDAAEIELIRLLDKQETRKGEGKLASATINETLVAQKVDWDATIRWISRTKNFQLLQQRISDPAYRELRALGKTIPGLEDFVKRSINLRNL